MHVPSSIRTPVILPRLFREDIYEITTKIRRDLHKKITRLYVNFFTRILAIICAKANFGDVYTMPPSMLFFKFF